VIVPAATGRGLTVKVNVSESATHGVPDGLSEMKVIVTVVPASTGSGVYVKLNGELLTEMGETDPPPFSEIVIVVAFAKVLPLIVIGSSAHVEPEVLESVIAGGFVQAVVAVKDTTDVAPISKIPSPTEYAG
jgi:hypothetical protein